MENLPRYLKLSITSLFLIAIASWLFTLKITGFALGLMIAGFIGGLAAVLKGLSQSKNERNDR